MNPKFKVGDLLKYYRKSDNEIQLDQIVGISDESKYELKIILPLNIKPKYCRMDINLYENNNIFTRPILLTDEEKLELL